MSSSWYRFHPTDPCPVCNSSDRSCDRTPDGLIFCFRTHGPVPGFRYFAESTTGAGMFRPETSDSAGHQRVNWGECIRRLRDHNRMANHATSNPQLAQDARRHHGVAIDLNRLPALAADLCVSVASLVALETGSCRDDRADGIIYTFPERDAVGNIVGILDRLPYPHPVLETNKVRRKGSNSGLCYTSDWRDSAIRLGYLLLVEGASDLAACLTMRLPAVSRPSNLGGVELLTDLLRDLPTSVRVIVVGENDRKADGRWPGRDGAEQTARRLACGLARPVCWIMSPVESKDTRAWLVAQGVNPEDAVAADAAGQRYVAALAVAPVEVLASGRTAAEETEHQTTLNRLADELGGKIAPQVLPPIVQDHAEDAELDRLAAEMMSPEPATGESREQAGPQSDRQQKTALAENVAKKAADRLRNRSVSAKACSDCGLIQARFRHKNDCCVGFCGKLKCQRVVCPACRLRAKADDILHAAKIIGRLYDRKDALGFEKQDQYKPLLRDAPVYFYKVAIAEWDDLRRQLFRAAKANNTEPGWHRIALQPVDGSTPDHYGVFSDTRIEDVEEMEPAAAIRRAADLTELAPAIKHAVRAGGRWKRVKNSQWVEFSSYLDNDDLAAVAVEYGAHVEPGRPSTQTVGVLAVDWGWEFADGDEEKAWQFYRAVRTLMTMDLRRFADASALERDCEQAAHEKVYSPHTPHREFRKETAEDPVQQTFAGAAAWSGG